MKFTRIAVVLAALAVGALPASAAAHGPTMPPDPAGRGDAVVAIHAPSHAAKPRPAMHHLRVLARTGGWPPPDPWAGE